MRIGIDVGGTNTDAVLMDGTEVLAWTKSPTTQNVSDGVESVLNTLLSESGVQPENVQSVMIGTTHFTNALVERKGLLEVGIIRLGSPACESVKPKIGWPDRLRDIVGSHSFLLPGGYEFDGREISSFDEASVRMAAREIAARNLRTVAISSVFAPINDQMERRAARIVLEEVPVAKITLSCEIGRLGLLERENAAILNAALADLSTHVVESFRQALARMNIRAPFYISQNDGTLMGAEHVEKYPVLTIASGPTNSMRGAAYLSGLSDAVVIDIGGTTSDLGVLAHGFPRESSVEADIGGVRTNFRMPDVLAIGLGGGTIIQPGSEGLSGQSVSAKDIQIGPESVGYKLTKEAFVFGGNTLTVTDIAVASGAIRLGNPAVLPSLPKETVGLINEKIHVMLEDALDRVKTSTADVPVILVGGGNIIVNRKLRGAAEIIRPELASVANAIGAAIAQVGAEVDRLFSYDQMGRDAALKCARDEAVSKVINAGGQKDSVTIIEVDEMAMSYMPGKTVRIRAKAVGNLAFVQGG